MDKLILQCIPDNARLEILAGAHLAMSRYANRFYLSNGFLLHQMRLVLYGKERLIFVEAFSDFLRYTVEIEFKDLENGILVVETSKDREVVKLIKQHAHKAVSEFVEQGMQRAMQPTPLPKGYKE